MLRRQYVIGVATGVTHSKWSLKVVSLACDAIVVCTGSILSPARTGESEARPEKLWPQGRCGECNRLVVEGQWL